MPAKSRKNRRNIPQNRNFKASPAATDQASPAPAAVATAVRTSAYQSPAKPTAAAFTYPHIASELKWIGLVTVLVAVILILTYIFLPK